MGTIAGWYYLHTNGDLIYKNNPDAIVDIRDSDFCRAAWSWDGSRQTAWSILVESRALGASAERIHELVDTWGCNQEDALHYIEYLDLDKSVVDNKYEVRCRNATLDQHKGVGYSWLEALSQLCINLGYVGGKLGWHASFEHLVTETNMDINLELPRSRTEKGVTLTK